MRVQNEIDRYHLVMDMIQCLPQLENHGGHIFQLMRDKLVYHKQYIKEYGEDVPEVKDWKWESFTK